MSALAPPTPPSACPAGFAAVQPAVLRRLDRWDIDLYTHGAKGRAPILLRDSSLEIADFRVQRLVENNEQAILIRSGDFANLSRAMLEEVESLAVDESIAPTERYELMQFAAAAEVEHACQLVDPGRLVGLADKLGSSIVSLVESCEMPPDELYRIARHDYHTFSHVTNVACYAALLSEALGFTDPAEQREIAVGAFLHDIGKRHIPGEILRKPGRLDDDERAIIQNHSQLGYEELVGRDDLSRAQLMMVYQHHEWVDGGGYPVGVMADEIHPWAQMLAVLDVFDAMTGDRPYRKPAPAEKVLDFLKERAGTQFNPEYVKCWILTLQQR